MEFIGFDVGSAEVSLEVRL